MAIEKNNVPSQLDVEDLQAEIEIELPDSQNNVLAMIQGENIGEIEIIANRRWRG
jgi:hypothetical protein